MKCPYPILVSACLAGEKCRYNAEYRSLEIFKKLKQEGKAVTVCPEVIGGLTVPRPPCEIRGGDGRAVLEAKAKVFNKSGEDVTAALLAGSYKALKKAKRFHVECAVLKSKSACCGAGEIFDGSFRGVLKKADGILPVLLKNEGIRVFSDEDFLAGKVCCE